MSSDCFEASTKPGDHSVNDPSKMQAKVKDVAYDMDELLDECTTTKIKWEVESRARRRNWKV